VKASRNIDEHGKAKSKRNPKEIIETKYKQKPKKLTHRSKPYTFSSNATQRNLKLNRHFIRWRCHEI
jgi:hypothetical protein